MRGKRGQNEGTWRQRPSGSWEYRFRFVGPNGFTQRGSVCAPTKAEARAKADAVAKAARAGLRVPTGKVPTLGSYAESWIADVLPHSGLSANTRAQYRALLSTHVVEHQLAQVKLGELRPSQLQALVGGSVNRRTGEPLAHSSKRSLHAALVAVLETAVVDGVLVENVMRKARRPKNPKPGRAAEARALSDEQRDRLLEQLAGDPLAILVRVALLTGMRRGELLGLEWGSVDFDAGRIRVRQQLTVGDDDPAEPKTAAGDRTIRFGRQLRDELLEHGLDQQQRLEGVEGARRELVFSDAKGRAITPRALSSWYAKHAAAAGLGDTGLHALRHTAVSSWLLARVPITVAASWAGHADPSVTLRLYSWALPGDDDAYADAIELPASPATSPTYRGQQHTQDVSG